MKKWNLFGDNAAADFIAGIAGNLDSICVFYHTMKNDTFCAVFLDEIRYIPFYFQKPYMDADIFVPAFSDCSTVPALE